MQVVMLKMMSGPERVWKAGESAEFGDAEGQRLIEAGIAAPAGSALPLRRQRRAERAVASEANVERAAGPSAAPEPAGTAQA